MNDAHEAVIRGEIDTLRLAMRGIVIEPVGKVTLTLDGALRRLAEVDITDRVHGEGARASLTHAEAEPVIRARQRLRDTIKEMPGMGTVSVQTSITVAGDLLEESLAARTAVTTDLVEDLV